MKIKNNGFSLMEVLITILIIAILSIISGPIYNSYSVKSKVAEGYLLLGTIKDAHMKSYNESGEFITPGHEAYEFDFTCNELSLGIDARANKYYTWFNCNNLCRRYGGGKTFLAIVSGTKVPTITMICPIDKPTTII